MLDELKELEKKPAANPELSQYLAAVLPRSKRRTWADDAAEGEENAANGTS